MITPNIKFPATRKMWAVCPYCRAKGILYDDTANCRGVWLKCTRGCKREYELIIKDGKQVIP